MEGNRVRVLEQVLSANKDFIGNLPEKYVNYHTGKLPKRRLAIFTCMDTRLVDFLEPAMGIKRGEAKIIKNAGNSVSGPFESTLRSLMISVFELDVNEIMVIGHLDCGMANITSDELVARMTGRGISEDAIKMVRKQLDDWKEGFRHPIHNVEQVVAKVRSNPLIPKDVPVHGLLFDPQSGELRVVVDGYGAAVPANPSV